MLLSEDGSVLSSKYLETVECVKTGNKFQLLNHLVEIFELRTSFAGKYVQLTFLAQYA